MEAVIFVGLQGAGKSTFYKERFFATHLRINLDMLKTRHRERRLLQLCVETRQPFVVDNTNVLTTERERSTSKLQWHADCGFLHRWHHRLTPPQQPSEPT